MKQVLWYYTDDFPTTEELQQCIKQSTEDNVIIRLSYQVGHIASFVDIHPQDELDTVRCRLQSPFVGGVINEVSI